MIINNQFYIFIYAGSEPLNLMEIPASITEDPIKSSQYKKFIQSIDTIYGSQDTDNTIPVFWTKRVQVVDDFGNKTFQYLPNEDSTLTQLDSKNSYYIILRNNADLPVYVPLIGNAVLGFTDDSALPTIEGLDNILLESTNKSILQPSVGNLQPYETYRYEYKGISSNWPITITPVSGTIRPSTDTTKLSSIVSFCATSGGCVGDANLISGIITDKCPSFNEIDLYSTLELVVTPVSYDSVPVNSNPVTIQCNNCLPRVNISLQENLPTINLGANTSTVDVSAVITNLEPTQNYTYEYVGLGANWPAMFITPISGTFTTYNSRQFNLSSKIAFCPTTSSCPSADSSVIDYVTDPKFIETFYTSFLLKVTPNTCSEPYFDFQGNTSTYSSALTIYCNDCL